jgi:hypothetical protein
VRYDRHLGFASAPRYRVSELHVEVVARHVQHASVRNVAYGLYLDRGGDGLFGPGDILYVRERSSDVLGPADAGSYAVRLMNGSRLLAAASGRPSEQARAVLGPPGAC